MLECFVRYESLPDFTHKVLFLEQVNALYDTFVNSEGQEEQFSTKD